MTMNAGEKPKSSNAWRIPMPVAIVLVLLCLAGGVMLLRSWLKRDANGNDAMAVDAPQRTGRQRPMDRADRQRPVDRKQNDKPADRKPRDVVVRDNGPVMRAVAGGIELRVRPVPGEKADVVLRPVDAELAAGQNGLLRAARRLLLDANLAKQVQLSDEQRKKLREVQFAPGLSIVEQDRSRLIALAFAWQQAAAGAARTAAEANLVAAMKDVGVRSVEPSKQAIIKSVEQVKVILTPQQLEQLQQADGKTPIKPKPATQPAAA
jgi:hypothetical protein